MKKIFPYSFILVILISFSCKKYPEDERRYLFKSAKNRLIKTNWVVETLTIDGADSTNRSYREFGYTNNVSYTFNSVSFNFLSETYSDDHAGLGLYNALTVSPKAAGPLAGWKFIKNSDKERIIISLNNSASQDYNTFKLNKSSQEFEIIRLDKKKLIIESIEDTRKIRFEFTAQ